MINNRRTFFIVGFLNLLVSSGLQAQSSVVSFTDELGNTSPIAGSAMTTEMSGSLNVYFQFFSSTVDAGTGLYVAPDYLLAFSHKLVGEDPVAMNRPWVFGGPRVLPNAEVISFDPTSGTGIGLGSLPIGQTDYSTAWPWFREGSNEVTIYWGNSSQIGNNRFAAPASPEGSLVVSINVTAPDVAIRVFENRCSILERVSHGKIWLRTPTTTDTTFSITSAPPGFFTTPATVTVFAGTTMAIFEVTPTKVGYGKLEILGAMGAESSGYARVGQPQKVIAREEALLEQDTSAEPQRLHAECNHAVGANPPNPKRKLVCGEMDFSPVNFPDDDGICPADNGNYGYFVSASCSWQELDVCFMDRTEELTLQVYTIIGVPFVDSDFSGLWNRWCCFLKPVPGETFKHTVKDCR